MGVHKTELYFGLFQYNEIAFNNRSIVCLSYTHSLSIVRTTMCASYDRQIVIRPFNVSLINVVTNRGVGGGHRSRG